MVGDGTDYDDECSVTIGTSWDELDLCKTQDPS